MLKYAMYQSKNESPISNNIVYMSDFDQLTWMIDLDAYSFYECHLPFMNERQKMRSWLKENCTDQVIIWNGLMNPGPFQRGNWGSLVSPDLITAFLIFLKKEDEVRFALEFVNTGICVNVHTDGWAAYKNRLSSAK